MSNLPKSLQETLKSFFEYEEDEQIGLINKLYHQYDLSFSRMAKLLGTYPNRLRRLAVRAGIELRTKGEAQQVALATGTREHPTKGKKHSDDAKLKISEGMASTWLEVDDVERARRSEMAKAQWESLSPEEQEEMHRLAGNAVREAAKIGSKLERYVLEELINAGYKVDFHKEHLVKNDRLQVDLFVPKLNTAIEIDGPSHFSPIWGDKVFERNIKADAQKDGLLLGMGFCVVRVKQRKRLSQKYQRDLMNKLLETLDKIKQAFPEQSKRHIILEL